MICASGRAARRRPIDAASRIAGGISARNERIIHTAIGRFIEVYRITSRKMLSQHVDLLCDQDRSAAGPRRRQHLRGQKKNITSVHLRTGRIEQGVRGRNRQCSTISVDNTLRCRRVGQVGPRVDAAAEKLAVARECQRRADAGRVRVASARCGTRSGS